MIKQKREPWWLGKSLILVIVVVYFLFNSTPLFAMPANGSKNEFYPGDAVRITVIEIGRATDRGALDVGGDYKINSMGFIMLPLIGEVPLGTPLLFDIGVFIAVIGFALTIMFVLYEYDEDGEAG